MADLTSIIAGIDGMRNYESNRALSLSNQAQDMQNQQMSAVMRLKNELAGLQNNPYAKWGIYDPQGRHQQLLNEDKQLQIASKWANSIKNLAPEKRAQGYAQFLRAMPTLGIDVSDMPQGYDEAYVNQLADLGIETETRYQNEQANARQERQIAATQANLERQIAANREARQDEFEKRLAAYDYKNNSLTKAQQEKIAEADEYINGLGLDEELTMRLKARNHGIELPEMPSELSLKEQSEIAKNAGLTLDPEALNEGRIVYAAKPQANASGDAYLYQQMLKNGVSPTEALDRLGKMAPETKLQNEIALKQAQSVIENQAAINRDNNKLQNDVVLEGIRQGGRTDLANLNAQIAETAAQNEAERKRQLEEFKASMPTAEQKNIQAAAAALNLPESAFYQQAMEQQQAQIANIKSQIADREITPQMRNYQYLQQNPDAVNSPVFQGSGTRVTVNTGDVPESAVFDMKTLNKERAKQYVKDVDEYENMVSKMPELQATVERLKELAPIATYTTAGRVRDRVAQEAGRPTIGSVARDEYESIIANQILPLLRDTFGAQFTEREGNSLKATLGDPNKSAQSKVKVLDSFINQKSKSIESKFRKLQAYEEGVSAPTSYAGGEEIIDFSVY